MKNKHNNNNKYKKVVTAVLIFVFGFFFSVCPYKLRDGCQKIHQKK